MYSVTAEQTELWKKSADPVYKQWADGVRKVGGDPDALLKDLRTTLAQHKAAFWSSDAGKGRIFPGPTVLNAMTAAIVSPPSPCREDTCPNLARIEVRGGDDWVTRNKMDRFIATIELIAAFFVGLVAVDIFATVLLRYFFSISLPDSTTLVSFCSAS